MTGPWRNAGVLLAPEQVPWAASHVALPCTVPHGDHHRVFFSARDAQGRSHVGWCDADLVTGQVLAVCQAPVLGLGELGTFDDSGVTPSCVLEHAGRLYLYYTGWSLGQTVPFYFYVGLAVSEDGGASFRRVSRAPVFERTDTDPYLTASPCVRIEDGRWRAWYVSCLGWRTVDGEPRHDYAVRHAESVDGVHWARADGPCVAFQDAHEYAHGRPCVRRHEGRYEMFFAARGEAYALAYAESPDGLAWTRQDAALAVPRGRWDAAMQAYPWLVETAAGPVMLYNGDGYGRTGIGRAVPGAPAPTDDPA